MLTPMQNEGRNRPIPRSLIRRFVRRIAERFQPEKVILFGSYAYGHPTNDSDVDLLVIMDTPSREVDQAVEIRLALDAPFPLDLMVRRPQTIEPRIALGDYFLREITERGKVLYERPHPTPGSSQPLASSVRIHVARGVEGVPSRHLSRRKRQNFESGNS